MGAAWTKEALIEEFVILGQITGMMTVSHIGMSAVSSTSVVQFVTLLIAAVTASIVYDEPERLVNVNKSKIYSLRIVYDILAAALGVFCYGIAFILLATTADLAPDKIMKTFSLKMSIDRILAYSIYLFCLDFTFLSIGRFIANTVRLMGSLIFPDLP